ncbi:chorismate mutase [Caldisphaera lagunensis]|uniref:chorismate mutase n=1 Tax=Caldisphaera lagunensis TaxID=200415 RepID=UPI0006627CFF|nr:chorismate mutase [Caldisphaera lagunensis]
MEDETIKEIKILREKINELDDQIINLLNVRISICKEIGKIKRKNRINIEDKERENEILQKAGNFKDIYIEIIETCKKTQGDIYV